MRRRILVLSILLCAYMAPAQVVRELTINAGAGSSNMSYPTIFNGDLYFHADNGTNGYELWKYDGATASMVYDINSGASNSVPHNFTVMASKLYFMATDGGGSTTYPRLWSYDGTNTPSLAHDFGAAVENIILVGSVLYIVSDNQLWSYDGTNPPTSLFNFSGNPIPATTITFGSVINATATDIYFTASTSGALNNGLELYKYSGSGLPTMLSITPGSGSTVFGTSSVFVGANLYFFAKNTAGTEGMELYRYPGTGTAVTRVYDINPGAGDGPAMMNKLTEMNGTVYFSATNGTDGYELWKYDGTNNPSMVFDIAPGSANSYPWWLHAHNNVLYFQSEDGTNGVELWKYTGSGNPTMVENVNIDGDFYPQHIFAFENKIYMRGDGDDGEGDEVWMYDPAGTGNVSEPTTAPTGISFTAVSATEFTVNWTNGNGANRIVVVREDDAVDAYPLDNIDYGGITTFALGSEIGTDNYVVYNGSGTSVTVAGLSASTTYHVAIIESNGTGSATNYLISSVLRGNQATTTTTAVTGALATTKSVLYPNPISQGEQLTVSMEGITNVKIRTSLGTEVYNSTSLQNASTVLKNSGVYFVEIQKGSQTYYEKLVVK